MRHCIIITLLIFQTIFSYAQIVQRQHNETAEQFANRLKPDNSTLTHKAVETKWNGVSVVISLYNQTYKLPLNKDPDQSTYNRIIGSVFIQSDSTTYKKTRFGTIDTEGGDPSIESIFFANADKDSTRELIIIASWEQKHYDVNGTLYGTYVFDYDLSGTTLEWKLLEAISNKLEAGCECTWRDGTKKTARFKTASSIRKELVRLGYKQ